MFSDDLRYLDTDPAVAYAGTLAQYAISVYGLAVPADWKLNSIRGLYIQNIALQSVQNLAWNVWFARKNTFPSGVATGAGLKSDSFIGYISLPAASGVQVAAANQYYYSMLGGSVGKLDLPFYDTDASGTVYVGLQNMSVTGKLAGDAGAVKITLGVIPYSG